MLMSRDSWLRLLQFGFCVFLLLFAMLAPLSMTLGTSDSIKKAAADSGAYGAVARLVSDQAGIDEQSQLIREASASALTPQSVQASAEATIDDTYRWLDGTDDEPRIRIDLTPVADRLKVSIRDQARQRAASMPVCSPAQLQALAASKAAFLAQQCLPPGASAEAVGDLAVAAAIESNTLLKDPIIDVGELAGDGQSASPMQSVSAAPAIHQSMVMAPWIAAIIALVLAALCYVVQRQPARTVYSLARTMLIAGLITLVVGGLAHALFYVSTKPGSTLTQAADGSIQEHFLGFAHRLEAQVALIMLAIGAIFAAVGAIVAVTLKLIEHRAALRAIEAAGDKPSVPTTADLQTIVLAEPQPYAEPGSSISPQPAVSQQAGVPAPQLPQYGDVSQAPPDNIPRPPQQ